MVNHEARPKALLRGFDKCQGPLGALIQRLQHLHTKNQATFSPPIMKHIETAIDGVKGNLQISVKSSNLNLAPTVTNVQRQMLLNTYTDDLSKNRPSTNVRAMVVGFND